MHVVNHPTSLKIIKWHIIISKKIPSKFHRVDSIVWKFSRFHIIHTNYFIFLHEDY